MIELTLNQKFALAYAAAFDGYNNSEEVERVVCYSDNCDFEYKITHQTPIIPARITGKPEDCYPAEGGELEFDLYFLGYQVNIEELPATVFDELEIQIIQEVFN